MQTAISSFVPPVFQIGWLNSSYCSSAPSVMYNYTGISTELYNSTIFETTTLTSCGNNYFSMQSGCCLSTLDDSFSYASMVLRRLLPGVNFPMVAVGAHYCHLQHYSKGSLWDISDIWYLNDGSCIDSHFQCMPNGQFTFYSIEGCKGENQSVQLGSMTNMTIGGIGNVNAEFVKINTGVETYRWTAFIPAAYLVYRYHVPMEIIAAISYACGWILSIFVLGYFVYRYVNTKSMYMLILAVSQLLWIIWEVMDFSYYNIVFPDSNVYYAQIYGEIEACIFNLATLTTVLNTCNLILTFNQITSKWKVYGLYFSVILLHIGLSGGKFDTYDASIQGAGNPYASWMQIAPLWILLMIIINTVPAFMITIRLLKNSECLHEISTLTAICKVFKNNSLFAILVILQVVNSISYIICTCIQNYTEILGSDRNFLGLNGIIALLFAIHSAINCLFIEHIRVFLKVKTKFSSYKNLQQSIVIVPNGPTEPLSEEIPFRNRKRLSTIEEVCVFEEGAADGLPQLF